jgi:hypothetical protein
VLPARLADPDANPAVPAALAVLAALSNLTDSEYVHVELAAVDVVVTGRAVVERERILGATVLAPARAGERAVLAVRLQPFEGAPREARVEFRVPRGLPPGSYAVAVAGESGAARIEREGGLVAVPLSWADQLAQLKDRPPPGSMSVYLVREQPTPRLAGRALPGLPPSLVEVTAGGGGVTGGGSWEERATRLQRSVGGGVIVGEATARLIVPEEP